MPDWKPEIRKRLAGLRLEPTRESAIVEELAQHLDDCYAESLGGGVSEDEAFRAALAELSGSELLRPELRRADQRRGAPEPILLGTDRRSKMIADLWQDLRYGARTLRKAPAFTAAAVLTLALGVGATTAVFSVVNAVLLRPLPFDDPGRLVWVSNGERGDLSSRSVQVAYLQQLQAGGRLFSDVAGFSPFYNAGDHQVLPPGGAGEPERVTGVAVTENLLPLLGVRPRAGRLFTADECRWGAPKSVLLGHDFWARRFAADPGVVGRALTIDGAPATVVGVLPASFDFTSVFAPGGGGGGRVDYFTPFPLGPETNRQGNTLALVGRLRTGATPEAAQAEAVALAARADEAQKLNGFTPRVRALREHVSGGFRPAMAVLSCAVGLVMLIVCANLSNLLLSRTAGRAHEIAVRVALGAGRGRLLRQLLTESLLLSCGGAALGLLLAVWGTRLVSRLDTAIPLLEQARVDAAALGFTLLAAVAAGTAFSLTPALRASAFGGPHGGALKEGGGRGASEGRGQGRLRRALVVAEVALACVLLVGAGLLLRSFLRVLDVELGYRPEDAVAVRIDPGARFATPELQTAHYAEALRRLGAAPGVEAAGLTDVLPLGFNRSWPIVAPGQDYARGRRPHAYPRFVSEGYLRAMGVDLRAGRDFTAADDARGRPVIIVNETLARTLWPGEDPLGRVVRLTETRERPGGGGGQVPGGADVEREVVGVVRGTRHKAVEQESGGEMYVPLRQSHPSDYSQVHAVVRGPRPAADLAAEVRAALRPMDSRVALNEVRVLEEVVRRSLAPRRFMALLVAGFAGFALGLASLGIYGVISYATDQRRREFGVRLALGASPGGLRRGVVAQTIKLAALGVAIGMVCSWPLGRTLEGLLYGVTPSDPVTFAAIPVALIAVAALAGYVPARRASRLNPVDALRAE